MKTLKHSFEIIFFFTCFLSFTETIAQTIKLVPNQPSKVVCLGDPILFNNDLFVSCLNVNNKQYQFAKFDGTNFSVLTNPTTAKNTGPIGPFIIFNSLLTSTYLKNNNYSSLSVTNGNTVSLIPKSVAGEPLYFAVVNAGNLYYYNIAYDSTAGSNIIGIEKYDGNKSTFIPPPSDAFPGVGAPFVFNKSVYTEYFSFQTFTYKILKVTGNTLTPVNTAYASFNPDSIVYKGKLWGTFNHMLAAFDGTTITPVNNPDNGSVLGLFRVYKNKLCFRYRNAAGLIEVGTYDGNTTNLYSYGNNNFYDSNFTNPSIIYNGALYFQNANTSGKYQLAKFNGTHVSLIKNPDTGRGVYGYDNFNGNFSSNIQPILCYGNLYVDYVNKAGRHQLAQYDDSELTLIPNLSPRDTGYWQHAIVYKKKLYFIYISLTMGENPPTLAYLDITGKEINNAIANKTVITQNNSLTIYPNPAKNTVHISYKTFNAETLLQIVDMNGRVIWQNTASSANGINEQDINIASLPAGKYTLQVKTKNGNESKSFIKY